MKSIRQLAPVAALLLVLLLMGACGSSKAEVTGKLHVEPQGRTQMVVSGNVRTVLELDVRAGSTVVMQADDGETRDFAAGNSYRKAFTGALTIVFVSQGDRRTTIHYRAKSAEAVDVKVVQIVDED